MVFIIRIFFGIFLGILALYPAGGMENFNEPVVLSMMETGAFSIVERSDWRRFDNGLYTGLVYQEVRGSVLPVAPEEYNSVSNDALLYRPAKLYRGNFYVLQNTIVNARHSAQVLDEVIPVCFELHHNGEISIENDRGFPRLRGFPVFPEGPLRPGDKWQAAGSRAADPLNSGFPLIIPIYVEYEYRGIEVYRDMQVHRINAAYASRYQSEFPEENGISRVQGSHRVDILVRVEDGLPVFMRDTLDLTYTLSDQSTIRFAGFTLTFGQGIVPLDREQMTASIEIPETDIITIPEGIRLMIRDIRFVPDLAEFLPEENYRLDLIAQALEQIPNRTFLVEGHTAAVNRPAEEMELSIERARRMVDELVRRGISADRFIYKGWGGTKPIDDNTHETGRSRNRRVEITVLE